jgi:hypothetical protein
VEGVARGKRQDGRGGRDVLNGMEPTEQRLGLGLMGWKYSYSGSGGQVESQVRFNIRRGPSVTRLAGRSFIRSLNRRRESTMNGVRIQQCSLINLRDKTARKWEATREGGVRISKEWDKTHRRPTGEHAATGQKKVGRNEGQS